MYSDISSNRPPITPEEERAYIRSVVGSFLNYAFSTFLFLYCILYKDYYPVVYKVICNILSYQNF
jgi:hypothetical protein